MFNSPLLLSENKQGRDIVASDIHGEFHELKKGLKKVNFDPQVDRILVAGDLVDKGQNSKVAIEWLKQDFFFSVFGNHDAQFAFFNNEHLFSSNKPLTCFPIDNWFFGLSETQLKDMAALFLDKLYPAIQIETANGLVGIVHASTPIGMPWETVVKKLTEQDHDFLHDCMWDRGIAKKAIREMTNHEPLSKEENDRFSVPGLKHIFHGHTYSARNSFKHYSIGNRYFIDSAAFKHKHMPQSGITLFDINDPVNPIYRAGL
ncbi:metallophosphoesterase [Psychromonas sp. SP041]|uniref:metallophosphoesterase n=1 Tax=Psychromonas sp. SP041 TaxID=1365007 RepID=UPI0010C7B040|nr:metallophosphoesterase [Psychromonas sp. SP041]